MKANGLTLTLIGLVTVLLTGFLVRQQLRLARANGEIERLRSDVAPLPQLQRELAELRAVEVDQAELKRLREREAATQLELPKLRGDAAQARRAAAEAARLRSELERQAAHGPDGSNRIAAPMTEMVRGTLEQSCQLRLNRMQERLSLTPVQTQAVQQILSRRARALAEAMGGAISGKVDQEKLAASRDGFGDPELEIRGLLSPEQQTAYTAWLDDEKSNQACLAANSELLQMQHAFGVREDQADAVLRNTG
jgi:hypothetical protein